MTFSNIKMTKLILQFVAKYRFENILKISFYAKEKKIASPYNKILKMCYRYKIASFNFTRKKKKYTMDSLKEKRLKV